MRKTKALTTDTSAPADTIPYDQAVAEGKEILAQIEDITARGQLRLGELAAKVETKYKDRTLAKFAKAIGIAPCTLARYRDVFRAYEDICAPGRESIPPYAVLRELATHPNREKIIRKNPDLTKREAQARMRELKGTAKEKREQEQEDEWLKHDRKWFKELVAIANEVTRVAGVMDQYEPEQLDSLRQVIDPALLMYVRRGGRMLFAVANRLAELLGVDAEEASVPIERVHPEATAHMAA